MGMLGLIAHAGPKQSRIHCEAVKPPRSRRLERGSWRENEGLPFAPPDSGILERLVQLVLPCARACLRLPRRQWYSSDKSL
jgi:hypothetical protein